jgi:hypothetical protein
VRASFDYDVSEEPLGKKHFMDDSLPKTIAINPDDYHARHVGRTADGRQFFLTTPFEPAIGGRVGREFRRAVPLRRERQVARGKD